MLETYFSLNSCLGPPNNNCHTEPTFLAITNQTIDYDRYSSISTNGPDPIIVSYFRRSLKFLLYKLTANNFQRCGSIALTRNNNETAFSLGAQMSKTEGFRLSSPPLEAKVDGQGEAWCLTVIISISVVLVASFILALVFLKFR